MSQFLFGRSAKIICGLLALVILAVAAGPPEGASGSGHAREDWPCALLTYTPGMGPADTPRGLTMAVWRDGVMLFSASECRPGEGLLVGQASAKDVDAMVEAMIKASFFGRIKDDPGVPDGGYATISLRMRSSKTRRFHGYLLPSYGQNAQADDDYWALVKMFRRCEAELHAISPHGVDRLEDRLEADGTFRGYVMADPSKTPWMNAGAWR